MTLLLIMGALAAASLIPAAILAPGSMSVAERPLLVVMGVLQTWTVAAALLLLQVAGLRLHDVSFLVIFLFGQTCLDFPQVEQLSRGFPSPWQFLLKVLSVGLKLSGVTVLGGQNLILVIFLGSLELAIPVLIELLVLLDVSLFALFTLLLMQELHFFDLLVVVLVLQLGNPVFGHFSLDIAAILLTGSAVLFHRVSRAI